MMGSECKWVRVAAVAAAAMLCMPASADRGQNAYKRGEQAQNQSHFDEAYAYFKQAYTLTPNNPKYFAAYTRSRFNAANQHIHTGQLLRSTGGLKDAIAEFQRAVEIDSSNFLAQQELRSATEMLRQQERQQAMPKVNPATAKPVQNAPDWVELRPLSSAPITLHMTSVNADVVYRTICKLAGLNVSVDADYRPQKITVDLSDVTLEEALDTVRFESKTFWRPVSQNTIFVAADSPAKRKDLEQNVMRTFYLRNISAPNELQEAANAVRQMLDVSRVQLIQAQDALILRATPDQMALAEKLLADIDKPKPEVVIDIAVMQVSRDRIRTLGMNVPTSTSISILPKGVNTGGSGASSGNSAGFNLNGAGNFVASISGASFTFLASDGNTKILQNPEIRAIYDQKATLRIGDRVPIATGSFQPGVVGGGTVSPLINTQFQYLDVGVNIDITPHIHSDNDVTLKMAVEISSVTGSENIGGITQPIIGQRRIEHETRLADGDVNLLGGILEETETQSMSGYPWLSRLPILRYLFAQDNRERREDEIVFAITPHIVRGQDVRQENLRAFEVGTGSSTELRRKPVTEPPAPAIPPAVASEAPQASPSPAAVKPAGPGGQ